MAHHIEVQTLEIEQNRTSRYGRNTYKDIHFTEGGLHVGNDIEKSAEVIVLKGKRAAIDKQRSHRVRKE